MNRRLTGPGLDLTDGQEQRKDGDQTEVRKGGLGRETLQDGLEAVVIGDDDEHEGQSDPPVQIGPR